MTTGKPLEISVVLISRDGASEAEGEARSWSCFRTPCNATVIPLNNTWPKNIMKRTRQYVQGTCVYMHGVWHTSTPPALGERSYADVHDVKIWPVHSILQLRDDFTLRMTFPSKLQAIARETNHTFCYQSHEQGGTSTNVLRFHARLFKQR